jgi:hypothetical protein
MFGKDKNSFPSLKTYPSMGKAMIRFFLSCEKQKRRKKGERNG